MNNNQKVKTMRGDMQPRLKCRSIEGSFYLMNRDVFIVNGKWNRINNNLVCYDLEKEEWVSKKSIQGKQFFILDKLGKDYVYGATDKVELLFNMNSCTFIDQKVAKMMFPRNKYNPTQETRLVETGFLSEPRVYSKSVENNPVHAAIDKYKDRNFLSDEMLVTDEEYALLGDYTYGIELECGNRTTVNLKTVVETTMYPVRDGSIGGVEYITDIINSKAQLNKLKHFCKIAQKYLRPELDRGSAQVHIGGFKFTKTTFVAFYNLMFKLQDEIAEIMPAYRRNFAYLHRKDRNKDYCRKLIRLYDPSVSINKNVANIWEWLCDGQKQSKDNNFDNPNHPKEGQNKWNYRSRYYNVNFIPYFFQPKKTVEFRSHHMTFDYRELYAWMLICKATIDFALNNPDDCLNNNLKIYLVDILKYPEKVNEKLMQYITSCKRAHYNSLMNNNDNQISGRNNIKYYV